MDRLDRVIAGLRYSAAQGGWDEECTLRDVLAMAAIVDACVCNIGAQACEVHNRQTMSQEEKIAFRKRWDAAVTAGERKHGDHDEHA